MESSACGTQIGHCSLPASEGCQTVGCHLQHPCEGSQGAGALSLGGAKGSGSKPRTVVEEKPEQKDAGCQTIFRLGGMVKDLREPMRGGGKGRSSRAGFRKCKHQQELQESGLCIPILFHELAIKRQHRVILQQLSLLGLISTSRPFTRFRTD